MRVRKAADQELRGKRTVKEGGGAGNLKQSCGWSDAALTDKVRAYPRAPSAVHVDCHLQAFLEEGVKRLKG